MVDNILDSAKASLDSAKEKIKSVTENLFDDEEKEIIEQFKSSGQDKIKETFSTFSEYASLFKEAGYEIGSINANVSLPPEISITFKYLDSAPVEKRDGLIERAKDNKVAVIILKSLFKASDYSEALKIGNFKLKAINIKLGLIPGISVSLS
jgi:uncharacterized protein (UPF0210 family)